MSFLFSFTLLSVSFFLLLSMQVNAVSGGQGEAFCPNLDGAAIVGTAVSTDDNHLLYCEYHYLKNKDQQRLPSVTSMGDATFARVNYVGHNQQLIAQKSIDFSKNALVPNVEQVDQRHQETFIIQTSSTDNKQQINVRYQAPNSNSTDAIDANFAMTEQLVADAGFDHAVRKYWQAINGGKRAVIKFIAPVQQTTLKLSLKRRDISRCNRLHNAATYTDESHLCITAQAANVILNWFVDPITLVYSRDTQRLEMFSGVVNIATEQGGSQSATIHYRYQS